MKPRTAQMRQQQSQLRRAKIEESVARAQGEPGFGGRAAGAAPFGFASPQFNFSGGAGRRKDPNRGVISQAEWEALVESHEDSGRSFRYFFGLLVIAALLLLFLAKYDVEYNVEVPQIESGRGFIGDRHREAAAAAGSETTAAELEKYYQTLGVKGRLHPVDPAAAAADAAADKERRRENYRVRQELKRAFEHHREEQNQLVHCGRACTAHDKQIELAYNTLASQVDRELFNVLLDAKDTKSARTTSPDLLKKKYAEKREEIMRTEVDEEDRNMALEELKDAYDIIQDPNARKYYLLYGAKPPEFMRHVDARFGGWGQEMALGTYKYRIIIMWLDYLHRYIGGWGEVIVLLSVVLFMLARLPLAIPMSQRLLEDLGLNDDDAEDTAAQVAEAPTSGATDGTEEK